MREIKSTIGFIEYFTVERLNNLDPNDLAYLYSGQFEGDIVISEEELEAMFNGRGGRSGLIDERYRWTDNIVPYEINETQFSKYC